VLSARRCGGSGRLVGLAQIDAKRSGSGREGCTHARHVGFERVERP
jgi:hypothetical protein